jgi:hypothetical protein
VVAVNWLGGELKTTGEDVSAKTRRQGDAERANACFEQERVWESKSECGLRGGLVKSLPGWLSGSECCFRREPPAKRARPMHLQIRLLPSYSWPPIPVVN